MSPKIVQFEDGSYAIRRLSVVGWVYLDTTYNSDDHPNYWWGANYVKHTKFYTIEEGEKHWNRYLVGQVKAEPDYGTPVKGHKLPKKLPK